MAWYLLRRLLSAIPVMFFVSVVVFALLPLSGGDPALTVAGPDQEPAVYERVRREYGFDRPLHEQYLRWAGRALQGDLGNSILAAKFPVGDMIKQRLPVTVEVGALAVLFGVVVGVPLGVLAGAKRGSWTDFVVLNVSLLGYVTPGFVWGVVFILIFAVYLRVLPPSGFTPFLQSPGDNLRGVILPAVTLGVAFAGSITRLTRVNIIEVLDQGYITTARAKGLREKFVLSRHALKPAMIPVVTVIGLQMAIILGGTVITETLFNLPGLGKLVVDSIYLRDFPVVQGAMLMLAFGFVMINLLVDILYGVLDPRIKHG
jgi:peptide/nickel transport system permease protein